MTNMENSTYMYSPESVNVTPQHQGHAGEKQGVCHIETICTADRGMSHTQSSIHQNMNIKRAYYLVL